MHNLGARILNVLNLWFSDSFIWNSVFLKVNLCYFYTFTEWLEMKHAQIRRHHWKSIEMLPFYSLGYLAKFLNFVFLMEIIHAQFGRQNFKRTEL